MSYPGSPKFYRGSDNVQVAGSPPAMRDLQEFLAEAELGEYYSSLLTRLKVSTVEHLKYVKEEDLEDIGMTRPEMRRLKKFYRKECPQGAINKLRKAILRGGGDGTNRTLSPSPPQQRAPRPASVGAPYSRPPGKQLISVDSIQLNKILGEGEFGVVQQGVWTTETGEKLQVAVKKLSRERVNTGTQNFLKEAAIMQDVDHDHIVRMYGVVLDTDDSLMMVTELAPMRSLLECLKDPMLRVDLQIPRLCDYAQQVSDGMSYLESKRLVHRDLAARNILVFTKNLVKISDLGLSRILGAGQDYYQSKFSVSLKLPIAWCAPECINYLKFTTASDVWSFGVLLWEMFTYGFQPWAGMNGQQILEVIDGPNSQYLEQPDLCTNEMYQLMKECWEHDPDARPTFASILLRLPQLRPTQVKALKDETSGTEKGYLTYKAGDIIVVIDKSPPNTSPPGLVWRGVLSSGKVGFFDPTNAAPFIEPKISPVAAKSLSLARKESSRKSGRKIRADMISRPQNDLRHTGHIGYDGAVFGDVSFIGDAYAKLPIRVDTAVTASRGSSMSSIPHNQDSPDHNGLIRSTNSEEFLDKERNGYGQSWMSRESLNSQSTMQSLDGRESPSYLDVEDDSLFSDFKMPDLGTSFDFGPSFMDEVLKALDEKEKLVTSSNETTPTANQSSKTFETDLRHNATLSAPAAPVHQESRKSSSSSSSSSIPPLPSHPPRVEPPKERKQAKVKPMSASEEKVLEFSLARARELTSGRLNDSQSPPTSPADADKNFFAEESHGIMSRLKNSIKRSPKVEHKRTFSDDLENKGSIDDDVSPEAQQAYNMLVEKGSFKESNSLSKQTYSESEDFKREVSQSRSSGASSKSSQDLEANAWFEPDLIKDSKPSSSSSRTYVNDKPSSPSPGAAVSSPPPIPATRPTSGSLSKPAQSVAPVPAPRPVKVDTSKKSEIPVPKPRPEIQRVEPTVRQNAPASPDIPPKGERRIESHIPVPASRDSKEREREELKRTIEIVRVDDASSLRDEASDKASTSFDRSSARSSQRSSLDRSDNNSETSDHRPDWEQSECSSNGSKLSRDSEPRAQVSSAASIERKDSFNKKQTSSLFEEDLSEPSPQEIMNKLRERRLNRHMDHQKNLSGEGDSAAVVTTSRIRSSAREPQGIPGRTSTVDVDENAGGDAGSEEVDTNPLRMLRGGAIPIRTAGRGTAGNLVRGTSILRVPHLHFSTDISRSLADAKQSLETKSCAQPAVCEKDKDGAAAAQLSLELDKLTGSLMENQKSEGEVSAKCQDAPGGVVVTSDLPAEVYVTCSQPNPTPPTPPLNRDSPPKLPPRISHSLSEDPEKQTPPSHLNLRRSCSFNSDSGEAPALPPRNPQPGRTPLNSRPRERKYPLVISPSQSTDAKQHSRAEQGLNKAKSPHPAKHSSPTHSGFVHQHSTPHRQDSNPQPYPSHHFTPKHEHFPVSLPPAYDISASETQVASCEPTHMLLDPHSPHLPLHVDLPSAADLTIMDEPTHVSLSSLANNKHSWSATFTSPSPLSPSFPHRNKSHHSSSERGHHPKVFHRSISHTYGQHLPAYLPRPYFDDQSPPADLPPAPPTPSYREKLGLDLQKPKVTRSISHNSASIHPYNSHASFPDPPRGRSASDTSPSSHSPSPHRVFRYITHSCDDDDAFFDEAPSFPHPYSQTPFHPISSGSSQQISPYHTSDVKQNTAPPPPSPRTQHSHSSNHVASHNSQKPAPVKEPLPLPPRNHQRPAKSGTSSQPLFFKFPCITASTSSSEAALSPPVQPVAAAAHTQPHASTTGSSSDVSPLMFTTNTNASSVSYEDLRQFAMDRQKNCQEVEQLLRTFDNQVSVEECTTALEGTGWDVNKATKYLQLKHLLSLGLADVRTCKLALTSCNWDLQRAADRLLDISKGPSSVQPLLMPVPSLQAAQK
ncbi:activated Cdc42 kinase-like [Physella acuta]|uniref:activated Cdc42 kinase-like n=1 Tax=Physella acuta TaxID=109671 RepID=UPI0027DE07F3|nr:activated Cdc42 kinase-like [Physella acuta]